jgi:hypothetical protein
MVFAPTLLPLASLTPGMCSKVLGRSGRGGVKGNKGHMVVASRSNLNPKH